MKIQEWARNNQRDHKKQQFVNHVLSNYNSVMFAQLSSKDWDFCYQEWLEDTNLKEGTSHGH